MTTVEALKDLYEALGGSAADVADVMSNTAMLNAVAGLLDGGTDAASNAAAIANIAEVASAGGGGGSTSFRLCLIPNGVSLANVNVVVGANFEAAGAEPVFLKGTGSMFQSISDCPTLYAPKNGWLTISGAPIAEITQGGEHATLLKISETTYGLKVNSEGDVFITLSAN